MDTDACYSRVEVKILMGAIDDVLQGCEDTFQGELALKCVEQARDELATLREQAKWSERYRKQMVEFRDRAEALEAQVGPLCEALDMQLTLCENAAASALTFGEFEATIEQIDVDRKTLATARATLKGDGDGR